MSNIFTLIGTAWDFYRTQPVLNEVVVWLIALPLAFMASFEWIDANALGFEPMFTVSPMLNVLLLFGTIVLSIVMTWGIASVILIGKKLIKSRAGRSRSSFAAVRKQSSKYVANIFITSILRDCFSVLWALLLIIPGIIYSVRTFFFFVVIVDEGKGYRAALRQSKDMVKGYSWPIFWRVVGTAVFIFGPIIALFGVLGLAMNYLEKELLLNLVALDIIVELVIAPLTLGMGIMLYVLASIVLYAELKKLPTLLPNPNP